VKAAGATVSRKQSSVLTLVPTCPAAIACLIVISHNISACCLAKTGVLEAVKIAAAAAATYWKLEALVVLYIILIRTYTNTSHNDKVGRQTCMTMVRQPCVLLHQSDVVTCSSSR
jgi:hypothetical protein